MIYKKGRDYMAKFMWQGKLVRKSTRGTSAKTARSIEGNMRAELARGNWGILEKKLSPTLAEFLRQEFLPFVESRHSEKPNTLAYYRAGVDRLLASEIAGLKLDEITDQHAAQFAKRWECFKPTTVNCGLRTLRPAISLAFEWGSSTVSRESCWRRVNGSGTAF